MSKINFISEYLSDEALQKISDAIAEIENKTSGEVRVCIKKKRGFLQNKLTPREIALKEFIKLKMHKTADKSGVLFFIIFDEHKFEIIADEGINSRIPQEKWVEISQDIRENFKKENYLEGLLQGLNSVGETLIIEFPVKEGDKNELSNDVIVKP